MRTVESAFARACIAAAAFGVPWAAQAVDAWVQTVGNGFGDAANVQVAELHVFRGQLFAGVSRSAGTGTAQLWRSSDGRAWTQVTAFSPALAVNRVAAIISFGDSGGAAPQYLYFGSNNASGSGSIYRSADGAAWTQINGAGSGWVAAGNGFISPHLVTKDGYLYAGTANSAGAQVWRRRVDDSAPWEKVLDFAGIDATAQAVTYLYVFNGAIHAATGMYESVGGPGHLYSSASGAAGTWSRNAGVGDGFGNARNVAITSMVEFGGMLYLSTRNLATGGELYRSSDLVTWSRVAANGISGAGNIELHNLRVAQNRLWVSTLARTPALFQVWRSDDGVNLVQSNADGFGDANNTSLSGSTVGVTIGFGHSVFWAGSNAVTGAQVWQLDLAADCLFDWAERTYPALFAPAGSASISAGPYYFRHYAQTGAYLGTSSADQHLYYLGPLSGNAILDAGAASGWMARAACQ